MRMGTLLAAAFLLLVLVFLTPANSEDPSVYDCVLPSVFCMDVKKEESGYAVYMAKVGKANQVEARITAHRSSVFKLHHSWNILFKRYPEGWGFLFGFHTTGELSYPDNSLQLSVIVNDDHREAMIFYKGPFPMSKRDVDRYILSNSSSLKEIEGTKFHEFTMITTPLAAKEFGFEDMVQQVRIQVVAENGSIKQEDGFKFNVFSDRRILFGVDPPETVTAPTTARDTGKNDQPGSSKSALLYAGIGVTALIAVILLAVGIFMMKRARETTTNTRSVL